MQSWPSHLCLTFNCPRAVVLCTPSRWNPAESLPGRGMEERVRPGRVTHHCPPSPSIPSNHSKRHVSTISFHLKAVHSPMPFSRVPLFDGSQSGVPSAITGVYKNEILLSLGPVLPTLASCVGLPILPCLRKLTPFFLVMGPRLISFLGIGSA